MNWWMMIAGMLSLATAAVHVFLGGPEVHAPVQSSESLALEVRATMAVVWHGITAVLLLSGATKIYAALSGRVSAVVVFIAAQYLAFVALFVGYGLAHFGSLWVLPQWTLFAVIVGFVGLGLKYPTRQGGHGRSQVTA
ncbi:hypothetical protein [Phenylobacterium sp.]|uniref:hypothetical protein n=1 Tax=Phenylobacterium sp. TaxID=1871053 RepID=UPI00286E37F9|nr:hypothetical protein [Phenylobacterium sp.]